jgi:hypothetical protein
MGKLLGRAFVILSLFWGGLGLPQLVCAEVAWWPMPKEAYQFGQLYPEAQKLLYAFDYGHALVYEQLLLNKGQIQDPEKFEKALLAQILSILKSPPDHKVDEKDIAPNYVYKFPLNIDLFDWSHMLHQFVLDIMAVQENQQDMIKRVNEVFQQYKSQPRVAITDVCKTMLYMDGHFFSKAFRRTYPSFNLLIWSYHWFQIRLYEALMEPTRPLRDAAVAKTVADFWQLISNLPDSAEFDMMPETAKEAPRFAKLFPSLPPAFDNNHMLHDIVSDILTSEKVKPEQIRSEAFRTARMALDPKAYQSNNCNL